MALAESAGSAAAGYRIVFTLAACALLIGAVFVLRIDETMLEPRAATSDSARSDQSAI